MLKRNFLKRVFDVFFSVIGLVLSSPLWILFSLQIKLEDKGPVFLTQERVGKDGRIFRALKFRSMIVDAEKEVGPLQAREDDSRVTKVGGILRKMAMDELPQLINILKGDMSFVGPRALRPEEIEVHGSDKVKRIEEIHGFIERHSVRPGLTGLAQVYLPADAPRLEKFRYDMRYIKEQNSWLDLKLIILSFWITFRRKWESRSDKIK